MSTIDLIELESAPEPGKLEQPERVSGQGESHNELELTSAGYCYLWDTQTGEKILTPKNIIELRLKRKRPEGTPFFTNTDPHIPQPLYSHKCLLHPEHKDREIYRKMGMPTCPSEHIKNEFEVENHMRAKHGNESKILDRVVEKEDRERLIQMQTTQSEALQALLSKKEEEAPLYVSGKDKAKEN